MARLYASLWMIIVVCTTFLSSLSTISAQTAGESADSNIKAADNFCGRTYRDAATTCPKHCPNGDSECAELGEGYKCHKFTGCNAKVNQQNDDEGKGNLFEDGKEGVGSLGVGGGNNNQCGSSWISAMLTCGAPCPRATECSGGDRCYAATNCDKPLLRLEADMLVTLLGADTTMEETDGEIFGGTLFDLMKDTVEEEGVSLDDVNLGRQSIVGRRELSRRGLMQVSNETYTRRQLATGSSALDVSMVITGDYRPPPYLDLNVIAEDSINRQKAKVVSTLRERGERAGRTFFERVEGIEAVAVRDQTLRPTNKPTQIPTVSPQELPSSMPSWSPSTSTPTVSPSRAHNQVITTGSQEDLQLGGTTTSSYGYIFNIRTKPDAGVVLMNGLDFYTASTDNLSYELWTRLDSFKDFKGTYDGWDLIASGTIQGRGIGRYTSIPDEDFTPVSIPGGGETRAFYLTLETNDLVYMIGEGAQSDTVVQYSTEEIEVYEGESVLFYPFPSAEDTFFYRYPRQFLGTIHYDRLPCKPFDVYGQVMELPCPLVPTGSPTAPPPTRVPVTSQPSETPTLSRQPTAEPTISRAPNVPTSSPTVPQPSASPTTEDPTSSPIVPMRVNIVSVFRNVPEREMTDREIEKFLETTTGFLQRRTENQMVLEGIDLWHHQLLLLDAEKADEATPSQVSRGTLEEEAPIADGNYIPRVPAVEVTMILRISVATLPLEYLGNLAKVTIDENQDELLALLNEQSAFYTYFENMDSVETRVVERVTIAPTERPTTYAHLLAKQEQEGLSTKGDNTEESDGGVGLIVGVALGVGALWCCLTAISVSYLMKRRAQMQEEQNMANLLSQEKANPMGVDHTMDKSSKTDDHDDEEAPSGSSDNEKPHEDKDLKSSHTSQNRRVSKLSKENKDNEVTADVDSASQSRHDRRTNETSGSMKRSSQDERKSRRTSGGSSLVSSLKSSLKGSMTSNASSKGSSPAPSRNSPTRHVPRGISKSLVLPKRGEEARRQEPRVAQSMVASSTASRASNRSSIKGSSASSQTHRQNRRHSVAKSVVVTSEKRQETRQEKRKSTQW